MKRGKYRKAVFVIVYSNGKNGIEYLLLKRKHHWIGWEFPKGKIEKVESKEKAALREAREETGLKIMKNKIKRFNLSGKYLYHKKLVDRPEVIGQTFTLFSVEAKKGKVKLDRIEHSDYEWLDFDKALKKLKWKNQKQCLKVVNTSLINE